MMPFTSNLFTVHRSGAGPRNRRKATAADERAARAIAALPVFALPPLAVALTWDAPGWVLMWATAFALYAGCKWLTWRRAADARSRASRWRNAAYLLAWPGMDARAFLRSVWIPAPTADEWVWPIVNMITGAALVWIISPFVAPVHAIAAGWCGMIGIGLILHFGVFGLLSCVWRSHGIDAPRQFHLPIASNSLDEFWSRRWNRAFRDLSRTFVLLPMLRRFGGIAAMMAVFIVSGVLHELVISLPARAGFGLPTAYFCAQGAGILIANSPFGRRACLNRGITGWAWMLLFVAAPAYWLFHPAFVVNVVLPFLEAIGA